MPMKDAAERYSPEMAAAFTGDETSRAATMKSAGVRAIRMPRAPTPIVRRMTAAIALMEATSVIRSWSVDTIYQADELFLQAAGLVIVESADDQDDRIDAYAKRNERKWQAEYLGVVQSRQDGAQYREGRRHCQGEGQAHQRQPKLGTYERPHHDLAVPVVILRRWRTGIAALQRDLIGAPGPAAHGAAGRRETTRLICRRP
jgi:hypothetical protein